MRTAKTFFITAAGIVALLAIGGCKSKPRPVSGKFKKVAMGVLRDTMERMEAGEAAPSPPVGGQPVNSPEIRIQITLAGDQPSPEVLEVLRDSGRPPEDPALNRRSRLYSVPLNKLPEVRALINRHEVVHVELARPPVHGQSLGYQALNLDAQISHRVSEFAATYPGNTGAVLGAVFDEGSILASHVEFRVKRDPPTATRVTNRTTAHLSSHATHVAGTIGALGINRIAGGMAPGVRLLAFDWFDDLRKLATETSPIRFSSHSYAPMSGWTYYSGNWYWLGDKNLSEDGRFGKYDATSSELDRILFERPALVTVAAAGNDRNEGPPTQPHEHFEYTDNQRYSSQTVRPLDGQKRAGLDTLIGLCIAKNAICVGSIHDVTQAGNIQITDYSNWGPTDDFRIKPDLVANGQVLLSTSEADDTAYAEKSGTSMATPVVSGITALLSQHFEKARARSPLSVELKAILIHTAKDAGVLGPDPVFGWGSVNALLAGHVIALPNQHLIEGVSIGAGQEWSRTLTGMVGQLARITVVWSDPPAPANADGVNDQTATLINDIDVVLMAPDGKQYFPYSLNRTNPLLPATKTGPNHTDNVEVIDAPGQAGAWKLSIRGHVFKAAGPQKCSIVASGFQLTP